MRIINYTDFEDVDIRVGTILKATENNQLRQPSIILEIDFGEKIGIKKKFSSVKS